MANFKYKAFISYSHQDERWGKWLHRRLETYPVPVHIIGKYRANGIVPKRLKPIFRDRDELAAADNLDDKIEQALAQSENLIIICSPRAASSRWVNQEILFFKQNNREAKIFCIIVDGEPFASNMPGQETLECFPPALRFQLDEKGTLGKKPAEPLAADIRDHADGKRLGVLKLISGMIGVGLDEIVQRDMQRGRKRVMAITASSLAAVLVMGTLTGFALDARKEADTRRADAEENIEFMITDLKAELEPVGRLDALKVVGERAENYYNKYALSTHNDEALGRRARVFHFLGEIQDKLGDLDEADNYFQRAYRSTEALLARDPENPDRIFEHAQSAFWAGYALWNIGKYVAARPFFDGYISLAEDLQAVEPDGLRGLQEVTYAYTNLGTLLFGQGKTEEAYEIYQKTVPAYIQIAKRDPDNIQYQLDLANAYGWLADAGMNLERVSDAYANRMAQKTTYDKISLNNPQNLDVVYQSVSSSIGLAIIFLATDQTKDAKGVIDLAMVSAAKLVEFDKTNGEWMYAVGYLKLLKAEILIKRSEYNSSAVLLEEVGVLEENLYENKKNINIDLKQLKNKRLSLLSELKKTNSLIQYKHEQEQ